MKRYPFLFLLASLAAFPHLLHAQDEGEPLSARVREEVLSQRNPVTVHVSQKGVTTLEFPAKIKALDANVGGFTQKPGEESGDFYLIPGDNWCSVSALKPGVQQNLNVVLNGKAYALLIQASDENDFTVLFRFPGQATGLAGAKRRAPQKVVTPPRALGLLDKVKGYPLFSKLAPAMFTDMDVAEPTDHCTEENDRFKSTVVRVLRDNGMNALAFEVSLHNKSATDPLNYSPNRLSAAVGPDVYPALTGYGPETIPPGGDATAYFVVTGSPDGSTANDLSVHNNFRVLLP
jgi:hypothetical protein